MPSFPSITPEDQSPDAPFEPYVPVEVSFAWKKWKKMESQESIMCQHLDELKRQLAAQAGRS